MNSQQLIQRLTLLALIGTLGWGLVSCGGRSEPVATSSEPSSQDEIESRLVFNNITLEQADEDGKVQWKVKAERAVYSQDKQVARISNPNGELYEDGKPVYRIRAENGEIREDGEKIRLRGDVVAVDIASGATLQGDELEWTPKNETLFIRNNLKGIHPQVSITAQEARLNNRRRRLDVSGQVVAITKDPDLKIQSEQVVWWLAEERVVSNQAVRIDRLKNGQPTDAAVGDKAEVKLDQKIAVLEQNAELDLKQPPVRVYSNLLEWNLDKEALVSDAPVKVVHRQQQVVATANQGWMDLAKSIFYLNGNVDAIAQRNGSQLKSDRLTWNIPTERVTAQGNVDYRQTDPAMHVRGPEAVGKLSDQTIVVGGGRVVTEIVPEQLSN